MVREYLRTLRGLTGADRPCRPGDRHLSAADAPLDNGVRCAIFNRGFNEWDFFVPGDLVTVSDGHGGTRILRCGADGQPREGILTAGRLPSDTFNSRLVDMVWLCNGSVRPIDIAERMF
jgi:hypothetical protein